MSGLAALTANYTDSEDEDVNKEDEDENTRDSLPAAASNPPSNAPAKSATATPNSQTSAKSTPTKQKMLNLVSYGDIQDDNDDKDAEPVPMELESDDEPAKEEVREDSVLNRSGSVIEVDAWTEGGKLPPEPAGLCSPRIQESVNKAMKKKLEYGYDMNAVIQRKKAFRNPSIYEKLIQFCEIDEHGTNFPKDLYDGHLFGKESYYDELSKVQMLDMERREKAAKERNAKLAKEGGATHDSAPKRKSKWDQGPSAQGSSGSASKTIPAFGALKK